MEKIEALFFAANPMLMTRLNLEDEIREITEKIRRSKHRDSIVLIPSMAAQPDDLLQKLNEYKPHIVHFSAHGTSAGELLLLDKTGNPKPVSANAINTLFETLKDNIRVVILNACYSKVQALAIRNVIDCVIGMKSTITDNAAIVFSAAFYRAIGFGCSVKKAFEQGRTALLFENISEADIPDLLVKDGVDPDKTYLLEKEKKFMYKGNNWNNRTHQIVIDKPGESSYRFHETHTVKISEQLKKKGNKFFRINIPFFMINLLFLFSLILLNVFVKDIDLKNNTIKIESMVFCAANSLLAIYLILISLKNLKLKIQEIKQVSFTSVFKTTWLHFFKNRIEKKGVLIGELVLLLAFFPVIFGIDYYLFKKFWPDYLLLQKVLPVLAVFSIILINTNTHSNEKKTISEGIKILSAAILVFSISFSTMPLGSRNKYYNWVKDIFSDDFVENGVTSLKKIKEENPSNIRGTSSQIKPGIADGNSIKPIKQKSREKVSPPEEEFFLEEIIIEADAFGSNDEEALKNVKEAAFRKYNEEYPHYPKLKEGEYEFSKCNSIETLSTGILHVGITLKIKIKRRNYEH